MRNLYIVSTSPPKKDDGEEDSDVDDSDSDDVGSDFDDTGSEEIGRAHV